MTEWIIIDGYNLLHRQGGGRDMAARREALLRLLEQAAGAMAPRVTLVFDGALHAALPAGGKTFVEVVFSEAGMSADAMIEKLVAAAPAPAGILVVTSDRLELEAVSANGAQVMSCGTFLEKLESERLQTSRHIQRMAARQRGPTLGEFFP